MTGWLISGAASGDEPEASRAPGAVSAGGSGRARVPLRLVVEIHHQAIAVIAARSQQKALGSNAVLHVQHDAQIALTAQTAANALYRGGRKINRLQGALQAAVAKIDDHPIGIADHAQAVFGPTAEIENQASVVRCAPQAHSLHGG